MAILLILQLNLATGPNFSETNLFESFPYGLSSSNLLGLEVQVLNGVFNKNALAIFVGE